MPAMMRGGSSGKRGGRSPKGASSYSPAKLNGAGAVGLDPRAAVGAAGAVFFAGLALLLATGGRGQALAAAVGEKLDRQMAAAGFQVASVHVQGASAYAERDILRALDIAEGRPILGLDLDAARSRVEGVGWVKSAKVLRLMPDTLLVAVVERPRLAVWQSEGVASVVDPDGRVIPEADPGRFPDLPLVVGAGANAAAAGILPLVASRPRLMGRLEALVRVDGRRWDLRLKDGSLIQLPAAGEDGALMQLDQLDQRARLLELGFARIDLRDPQMIAVRPRDGSETPPGV
jgi:cell division protein FtsQ